MTRTSDSSIRIAQSEVFGMRCQHSYRTTSMATTYRRTGLRILLPLLQRSVDMTFQRLLSIWHRFIFGLGCILDDSTIMRQNCVRFRWTKLRSDDMFTALFVSKIHFYKKCFIQNSHHHVIDPRAVWKPAKRNLRTKGMHDLQIW